LVGFMATGKTLVGRILAERLGWPSVDADEEIERRAGKTIPDIFRDEGEETFRRLEGEVIQDLCSGSGRVIAAGGGAFVETENRQRMLSGCRVICLAARPETILERLARARQDSNPNAGDDNDDRPMLGGEDVLRRVTELLALRAEAYALAHYTLDTDGLTPEQVAERALKICRLDDEASEETK
jgi:shikimate kinase